MRVPCLS
jgi:hypothetical protein